MSTTGARSIHPAEVAISLVLLCIGGGEATALSVELV